MNFIMYGKDEKSHFASGMLQFRKTSLLFFIVCILQMFIPDALFASTPSLQGKKVSGTVVDMQDEPVTGASVVEKGANNGTTTGLKGEFSLTVSDNAILKISYLGFETQELALNGQTHIHVILKEDTQMLDEVVVVGYSTIKRENLTGAVSQIRGERLENRSVTNVQQALQGTVANLNIISSSGGAPGSTPSINIRGYTGLGTSQSPLVVIDGIQGGDINSVNMTDVESISVLKDAASAAIYGSSAPYGVIIINTKKGKGKQRPTITYNNNIGFKQSINLPTMMNSLDWANGFNEAAANAGRSPIFDDEAMGRIKDYQAGKITDETIKNPTAGKDEWYAWDKGNANNDWFKIYYKDYSFSQQHNVGVSGGGNHSNYYVGLGYTQQDGMYNYGDDTYKRYNARTNLSSDLKKWLTFNFRSAFARHAYDTPNTYSNTTGGNYMHQIGRKWPTIPLRNPDGFYSSASNIRMHSEGGRNKEMNDIAALSGEFIIRPLEGWDITGNYSYEGKYYNLSNHVKTIYGVLPSGNRTPESGLPNSFSRSTYKYQHHTVNAFSSYEKQLGGHYFKVLGGYTQELYDNMAFSAGNSYLYSDNLPSLSLMYGTSPSVSDLSDTRQLAIRGGFGRINYNYQEKYLIEFNGRYDGTSRFMKDVRFKFYPGLSAAWVPSKEAFWEPVEEYVNLLKIRVSYGQLGDQGFTSNYYPFYPSLSTGRPTSSNWMFSGGRESFISNPGLINPNLTWITATTIDLGGDFGFLNDRLNISFDWYKRNADDFVGPSEALPSILGTSAPQANNAALETRGFDLTLGWRDHINDFSYGINAVLSDYKGKVIRYPNPTKLLSSWYAGENMGDIWGYETVGLFQNEDEISKAADQSKINANKWQTGDVHYADLNKDGKIDWGENTVNKPGDKRIIGNSTPRYSFGLNMNGEYKGFDLNLFLQGIGKRDLWVGSNSNYFWGIDGRGDEWQASLFTIHKDRWSESNPKGYYPRYYMNSQMSKNTQAQTRYLQNAAYLRIKNIQLGYSLPASLIHKIDFQKVRIFVNVENPATFTKLVKTIDPEFSANDVYTGKIYPLQRTWACGVNITF
jgi:TonB-linked SusC/RagA family outer membrane protein